MRLLVLAVTLVAVAAGCGGSPDAGPLDTATEEAAERHLQEEASREGKAHAAEGSGHIPDNDE